MPEKKTDTTPQDLVDAGITNTTEPGADGSPVPPVPDDDRRDRVAMTSLAKDGSPDQTPDYKVLAEGGDTTAPERRGQRSERNVATPRGDRR